jgi:dTDP-4-dehydrorhamnose reductase
VSEPRVLILGAGGMFGHKMFQAAASRFPDTWCTLRGKLSDYPVQDLPEFRSSRIVEQSDAMDLNSVGAILDRIRPDVVVNCVGVIKQRPAAEDAVTSISLNSLLPQLLAAKLKEWGGRLVHISTDCVFDGARGHYTEDDAPNAVDLYGKTKALGEVDSSKSITLRTSIIGRELRSHKSLLDWFLAQNHGTVSGYQQAWWSGVTTNHLADLGVSLIADHPGLSGLYQVSSGRISKYDLLIKLRDAYDLDITVKPDRSYVLDRSLTGEKLKAAIGYECPPWSELLSQLTADPTPYPMPQALTL